MSKIMTLMNVLPGRNVSKRNKNLALGNMACLAGMNVARGFAHQQGVNLGPTLETSLQLVPYALNLSWGLEGDLDSAGHRLKVYLARRREIKEEILREYPMIDHREDKEFVTDMEREILSKSRIDVARRIALNVLKGATLSFAESTGGFYLGVGLGYGYDVVKKLF